MNGVAANGTGRSSVVTKCCVRVALPLLLSLAISGAVAWEDVPPATTLAAASGTIESRPATAQVELSTYVRCRASKLSIGSTQTTGSP